MVLESPVAVQRAVTLVEGRSSYLDADAGSLDSAGRRLALAEDDHSSVTERDRVQALLVRQSNTVQELRPQLRPTGVELCDWSQLADEDRQAVTAMFRERIVPVLV